MRSENKKFQGEGRWRGKKGTNPHTTERENETENNQSFLSSCERCEDVDGRRHVDAITDPDRSRTWSSTAPGTDGRALRVCAVQTPFSLLFSTPPSTRPLFFLSPYGRDVFFFYFRCLLFDWIGAQARSTDRPQRPLSAGNLSCFGTSTDFIPDGSTSKLLSTLDSGTQIERRLPNSNSSFLSLWDGEDEKETLMTSSFSFA